MGFFLRSLLLFIAALLGIRLVRHAWQEYQKGGRQYRVGDAARSHRRRPTVGPPPAEEIVDAAWEEVDTHSSTDSTPEPDER